jgi:hypothetical protein
MAGNHARPYHHRSDAGSSPRCVPDHPRLVIGPSKTLPKIPSIGRHSTHRCVRHRARFVHGVVEPVCYKFPCRTAWIHVAVPWGGMTSPLPWTLAQGSRHQPASGYRGRHTRARKFPFFLNRSLTSGILVTLQKRSNFRNSRTVLPGPLMSCRNNLQMDLPQKQCQAT